jgi:hypothetical protein
MQLVWVVELQVLLVPQAHQEVPKVLQVFLVQQAHQVVAVVEVE